MLDASADVYTPAAYDPARLADLTSSAWGHHLKEIAGRLRGGVSVDEARRELNGIAANPQAEYPRPRWASLQGGLIVDSLQGDMVRGIRPGVAGGGGRGDAVAGDGACVNVTSLLLARAGAALRASLLMLLSRTALGAAMDLAHPAVGDGDAAAGAAGRRAGAGCGVCGSAACWLALSPPGLPRVDAIGVDGTVFAFAFLLSALVGLAAGPGAVAAGFAREISRARCIMTRGRSCAAGRRRGGGAGGLRGCAGADAAGGRWAADAQRMRRAAGRRSRIQCRSSAYAAGADVGTQVRRSGICSRAQARRGAAEVLF